MRARYFSACLLLLPCLALVASSRPAEPGVGARQEAILPHPGKDEDPSLIRASDGRFYLAWFSERGGGSKIWMSRSANGKEWEKPWQITRGDGADFYPSLIQTRSGEFCLAWFRQTGALGVRNIYFSKSDRTGKNWSEPLAITRQYKNNWAPCLLEDSGGFLWIVWGANQSGNKDLFMVSSRDQGANWSEPQQITNAMEEDDFPYLAQETSGDYLLTWTRFRRGWMGSWLPNKTAETVLSRSTQGIEWSPPQALTHDLFPDAFPVIFSDPSNRQEYAAWTTTRFSSQGDIAALALSHNMSKPAAPFQVNIRQTHGYTARFAPLDETGRFLMVWVSKNAAGDLEIFRQTVTIDPR